MAISQHDISILNEINLKWNHYMLSSSSSSESTFNDVILSVFHFGMGFVEH
jgi:hypothetical protein